MNYELCKKLKDVGYPFEEFVASTHGSNRFLNDLWDGNNHLAVPTLSELMTACIEIAETKDFHLELNGDDSWGATVDCFKEKSYISGSTPEIAVANLYLELNK